MDTNLQIRKDTKGYALVYALIITSISLIILVSMMEYVVSQIRYGTYNSSKQESFQIAEAGISFYRWYLAHQTNGKTAQQIETFWTSGNPFGVGSAYEAEYRDPAGAGIGKYSIEVTPPAEGSTIVIVKSTGWTYKYPDSKKIIQVRLRRPSWSEYIMLSNDFVRFGSGTEVFGKVFANNGVHFDGVAHNTVYSAVSSYYDGDPDVQGIRPGVWTSWSNEYNTDMGSDVFSAGKSYPIPDKDFSGVTADLSLMQTEAMKAGTDGCSASACYFDMNGQSWGKYIILNSNGTFSEISVKNSSGTSVGEYVGSWRAFDIPDDGIIFVDGDVWLEGNIRDKRVSVVAARLGSASKANVYIINDINYGSYDGSTVLGVVSQKDIEIAKNSDTDLHIDAALLAQSGRVGREDYGSDDHKDTITVFGAIASNKRYGFAYTDGRGYTNRNLHYDNNLLYSPPPYFPTGNEYLMDLWEEL
ncbi:MAG: hypothetical protein HGB08_03280 [Candidatus Moranbacteria bacterium]|nr:hypothetical protein [Candidatus Moranbacteria bacterium]